MIILLAVRANTRFSCFPDCCSAPLSYKGSTYYLHETTMNWREAFGYCAQIGGHLAVADDATDFTFMRQIYLNYRAAGGATHAWVDGSDYVIEGKWRCESIDAPCPYLSWQAGQPDAESTGQHCLCFAHTSVGFHDCDCDLELAVICEFPSC